MNASRLANNVGAAEAHIAAVAGKVEIFNGRHATVRLVSAYIAVVIMLSPTQTH